MAVDLYVDSCRVTDANHRPDPVTMTGLALGIGLSCRQQLDDYLNYGEDFAESVKRAKAIVEWHYEMRLCRPNHGAGPIFALKNFGWDDKSQVDMTTDGAAFKPMTLAEFYGQQANPKSSTE
jgi:hypothetical protein